MNKYTNTLSALALILGLSMASFTGYAQGMYASLNAGYNFASGAQTLAVNTTTTANSDISEAVNISLGKGINLSGAFGYAFSSTISAELGVTYLLSAKHEAIDNDATRPRIRTEEYGGSMLKVTPTLVFTVPLEGSLQPYAKIGVVLGFGNTNYTFTNDDIANTRLDVEEWKFKGGLGIGLNSGFGTFYSLSDKMRLFGELNITALNYAPKEGELITATRNGVDELPGLDTIDKEISFVETVDNNANIPITSPNQVLQLKLPYGSIGINFGVIISF